MIREILRSERPEGYRLVVRAAHQEYVSGHVDYEYWLTCQYAKKRITRFRKRLVTEWYTFDKYVKREKIEIPAILRDMKAGETQIIHFVYFKSLDEYVKNFGLTPEDRKPIHESTGTDQ